MYEGKKNWYAIINPYSRTKKGGGALQTIWLFPPLNAILSILLVIGKVGVYPLGYGGLSFSSLGFEHGLIRLGN